MALKRKLFSTPAQRTTNAKRIKSLERKVAANKTEVQVNSGYTSTDLRSSPVGGSWNGILNSVKLDEISGRNYKTVSVKAALAKDISGGGTAQTSFRYRMIIFSNKNDSSYTNTESNAGAFPGPYDEAENGNLHLNFNVDMKRYTIYADRMITTDLLNDSNIQTTVGHPPLTVQHTFKTPKLVRLDPDSGEVTHGAIGCVVYRQDMGTGSVTRFLNDSTTQGQQALVVEHKWIDP